MDPFLNGGFFKGWGKLIRNDTEIYEGDTISKII
jgi:hypothetical protein